MTDTNTVDRVSRRSVLRHSAVVTGTLVLGGAAVDTAAATTQDGETFLELFAGESPLVVARGDALGLSEESLGRPITYLPDTTISGPEGILAFAPRRLADENGEVRPEDILVMTGVRALEGDRTTAMAGGVFESARWFPSDVFQRLGETEWFPSDVFMPEAGVEGGRVVAFRDEEWEPGARLFPEEWFPSDVFEPADVVEAGTSEFETADIWPLFGAAGHNFFNPGSERPILHEEAPWIFEELAEAETTMVLPPGFTASIQAERSAEP